MSQQRDYFARDFGMDRFGVFPLASASPSPDAGADALADRDDFRAELLALAQRRRGGERLSYDCGGLEWTSMHARRFACLLLGIWLACSVLTAWMTTYGFHAAPRLLLDYSERWNDLRVVGAVFFFVYLLLGTREGKVTLGFALILIAATVFERAFLTPQLSYFSGLANLALRRKQLRAVQMGILLVEASQLAVSLFLALLLIGRQHGRSGLTREEVNAIDKADHRHVNW